MAAWLTNSNFNIAAYDSPARRWPNLGTPSWLLDSREHVLEMRVSDGADGHNASREALRKSRSLGLPHGCRATKARHRSMSRSTLGIKWRYGSIFALHLFYNRMKPSAQRGVGLSLRRIVGRIVGKSPRQEVILGGGDDLIPINPLGCVIVLASLLVRRVKVV